MKYLLTALGTFIFGFLLNAQITIHSTIPGTLVANAEIKFDVRINKGTVSNFSKYQMDVPAGIVISGVECKTGSFSFENNRAKVIWVTTPTEPEIVITLKMNSGPGFASGAIQQKFYYLENGSKKEVESDPVNVVFSPTENPPPVKTINSLPINGAGDTKISLESKNSVNDTAAGKVHVGSENIVQQPTSIGAIKPHEKKESPKETATSIANGIVYKVQLAASSEKPIASKYASLKEVSIAKEGTLYKVLVGNFSNKEDAVKMKTDLTAKGFNGFVVTYQNGERIK